MDTDLVLYDQDRRWMAGGPLLPGLTLDEALRRVALAALTLPPDPETWAERMHRRDLRPALYSHGRVKLRPIPALPEGTVGEKLPVFGGDMRDRHLLGTKPPEGEVVPFPSRGTPGPLADLAAEEAQAEEEESDEEPVAPEVQAELEGWARVLRADLPSYRWDIDGKCGRVLGNIDLGGGLLVHVEVEQEMDADGDPEWIEATASLTEWHPPQAAKTVIPGPMEEEDIRGMDPSSPLRAVRVAIRKLNLRSKAERGVEIPVGPAA